MKWELNENGDDRGGRRSKSKRMTKDKMCSVHQNAPKTQINYTATKNSLHLFSFSVAG